MEKQNKILLCIQLSIFIILTFLLFSLAYYFPNLPPFVRNIFPKGSKGSVDVTKKYVPDERFLKWFNRDPERKIPNAPNIIVSPADGLIWEIREKANSIHIVIEMRYSDVHVQRVPLRGVVLTIEGEGRKLEIDNLIKDYELEKMLPFQKVTAFNTEIGVVKVRQITSFFAKRIEVFLKEGNEYERGERLGRVLAGSTVILEVPKKVKILIKTNQEVIGGETIVGRY